MDKETQRLEAFSDAVFAIAITLLILDLKVPRGTDSGIALVYALLGQWPVYMGFVISFMTLGIMWVNHHRMFNLIHRTDDGLLLLNTLFLFGMTAVPFPTAVLSEYFDTPARNVSAALYSGTFVVIAILFNVLWRYASKDGRLLAKNADPAVAAAITKGYSLGPPLYFVAFILAFFSAKASMAMNFSLALFWALPSRNPLVKAAERV
jgi:uncharacterized membrane protein